MPRLLQGHLKYPGSSRGREHILRENSCTYFCEYCLNGLVVIEETLPKGQARDPNGGLSDYKGALPSSSHEDLHCTPQLWGGRPPLQHYVPAQPSWQAAPCLPWAALGQAGVSCWRAWGARQSHLSLFCLAAPSRQQTDRPVSSQGPLSQPSVAHLSSPSQMAAGLGMHMDVPPGEGLEEPTRGPRATTTH